MKPREACRGEVWLTRLDPAIGNEIRKSRPCLIVSPDSMNAHLGTVIVMPMTSGSQPTRFRPESIFLQIAGRLLGDHIRSVSKLRLIRNLGMIDPVVLGSALAILCDMFAGD